MIDRKRSDGREGRRGVRKDDQEVEGGGIKGMHWKYIGGGKQEGIHKLWMLKEDSCTFFFISAFS
jgi:hypothetical protein